MPRLKIKFLGGSVMLVLMFFCSMFLDDNKQLKEEAAEIQSLEQQLTKTTSSSSSSMRKHSIKVSIPLPALTVQSHRPFYCMYNLYTSAANITTRAVTLRALILQAEPSPSRIDTKLNCPQELQESGELEPKEFFVFHNNLVWCNVFKSASTRFVFVTKVIFALENELFCTAAVSCTLWGYWKVTLYTN